MKPRRLLTYILFLAAVIAAGFLLTPWYRGYVEKDREKTCRNARIQLILQYQAQLEERGIKSGRRPTHSSAFDTDDLAEVLSSCLGAPFPEGTALTVEGDSCIIKGPCLLGGTYHIIVSGDDPGDILITCDHAGHGQVSLSP